MIIFTILAWLFYIIIGWIIFYLVAWVVLNGILLGIGIPVLIIYSRICDEINYWKNRKKEKQKEQQDE